MIEKISDLVSQIFYLQDQIAPTRRKIEFLQGELIEMTARLEIDVDTRRKIREALGLSEHS